MSHLAPPSAGASVGTPRRTSRLSILDSELLTGRKKVTLAPGHSLMDWIRLGRTHNDLSGVGASKKPVTPQDLALHNTPTDLWMAIRGKVYNVTHYVEYHPGGVDELMKGAGKDGTVLFDEIHSWVNAESMLEKCLVGPLVGDSVPAFKIPEAKAPEKPPRQSSNVSVTYTRPVQPCPTFKWNQSDSAVSLQIHTGHKVLMEDCVLVDLTTKGELLLQVLLEDYAFFIHLKLPHPTSQDSKVSVKEGEVEVTLTKESKDKWASLGTELKLHNSYPRKKHMEARFRTWQCVSNTIVTHDTHLLCFKAPKGLKMITPIGKHIHTKKSISGMEIARSYTVIVPSLTEGIVDPLVASGKHLYLMIKAYKDGAISPWITSLQPGNQLSLSDYYGTFDSSRLASTTSLVCFAAGTGFTSMVSIVHHALHHMPGANFPVKLAMFNKTQEDIPWRSQLDQLAKQDSRFSVTHILSQEDKSWQGLTGRINSSHVEEFVPKPSETSRPLLLISGPWAYNDVVESLARIHNLEDEHIHIFSQST